MTGQSPGCLGYPLRRDSSERAGRLEGLLGSYRRRLEALGELRRQVRRLEEQDAAHARRAAALEDELRRAAPARAELDTCRRQVQELQGRQAQAALEAEKWQFECGSLREKLEALLKDKERLVEERDALREANEELRCAQVQQSCLSQADAVLDSATSPADNLAAEILPAELRETLVRLQQENRGLCTQEAALQGQLAELQAQLDDSRRVRRRLDTQHRLSQQEVLELRGQLEELQQSLQEQGSRAEDVSSSVLKEKLEEHLEKLNEAHAELQKKREHLEGLEPRADSAAAQRIDELQQILRQKDEDMRAMEERYRRYVDKANSVIRRLDPAPGAMGSLLGVQALRNQLQEKEAKLQYLEMDLAKTLSQREQEERLIITAWYNMGLAQQHCTSWDRSSPPGAPQSFLSQQRQAATARRGPPRLPRGPLH
ncbi:Hook-like protein 2 isoform A [Alligator mississippiensis]|uniref:Hook-like protein 2 isoform A n=1 Tax=Alligator mississippiensis TaxID=8496 RepID=A0A151MRW5_ALLMI|nr:Hook-like protein 2 isoform A [Alligator mississippiensis]